MGDYARAEPLSRRSLEICEKARGPDHPDTATALNSLAFLYYTMGDWRGPSRFTGGAWRSGRKPGGPIIPTRRSA